MSTQEKSNQSYKNLALNSKDLTQIAGRYQEMAGIEIEIFKDIIKKINLNNGDEILDIGCGFGTLTCLLLDFFKGHNINSTLIDIPEIIERIKLEFSPLLTCSSFYEGNFPDSLNKKIPAGVNFNKILVYSVLHYVDNPYRFIDELVQLLRPGGLLLIGDIPNANKKGRFLSSRFGRSFDASYKNKPLDEIPFYRDQYEFISRSNGLNLHLCDNFLHNIAIKYRNLNCEVYVLPQDMKLPFFYTREDLLIKKNLD